MTGMMRQQDPVVSDTSSQVRDEQVAAEAEPSLPFYEALSLHELVRGNYPEPDWIVEGLIHDGDQVVLAGPPKIGKSILVTQLAVAVAKGAGSTFLDERFKIPKKRRVLVLSFEMYEEVVARRLKNSFLPRDGEPPIEGIETKGLDLKFIFGVNSQSSFDILDFERQKESKAKKSGAAILTKDGFALRDIIRKEKPDLVIFDTLIRIHALDENNNVAMSHLLKYLRDICSCERSKGKRVSKKAKKRGVSDRRIAHILVHHTRKDSGYGASGKDARAVRGAGAIHAEADLVLTLSEYSDRKTVVVSFSARRIAEPEDMYLSQSNFSFVSGQRPAGMRQRNAALVAAGLWTNFQKADETGLTARQLLAGVRNGKRGISVSNFRNVYLKKIKDLVNQLKPTSGEKEVRYKLHDDVTREEFNADILRD